MEALITEIATIIGGQLAHPVLLALAVLAILAVTTGTAARVVVRIEDYLQTPPCHDQR